MRRALLFLIILTLAAVGCQGNDSTTDNKPLPNGAGTVTNPSGQPKTPDEANTAALQKKAGESAGSQMAQAAKDMAEAKARTGEK